MAKRGQKTIAWIHKLASLVIGVQILLWVSGGLVMSVLDIEKVRSEHHIAAAEPVSLPPEALPPALAARLDPGTIRSLEIEVRMDRPLAEILMMDGSKALYDAATGEPVAPLEAADVMEIARRDYRGEGEISDIALIAHDAPSDYRGPLPVWRVDIANGEGTRLYISPYSGRVLARRSDIWRIYDFFWMLHIMDYKTRSDFNHPLLIGAAFLSLFVALSGLPLLVLRLGRKDFGLRAHKAGAKGRAP
ncbi:MAG: hypothetical protein Kow00104_11160 [Rhodothalassiaceae bacterium]